MAIVRIGLDIAKLVFQIHGVDGHGKATSTRRLHRQPRVLIIFSRSRALHRTKR